MQQSLSKDKSLSSLAMGMIHLLFNRMISITCVKLHVL